MYALLALLCLFPTTYSNEYHFIQTFGYDFSGFYGINLTTTNTTECINECIQYEDCIGIYMYRSEGLCLLMEIYSQYYYVPDECSNYVLKTPQIDYPGATSTDTKLSDIEQLLYNLMYASNGSCPNGWNVEPTTCQKFFKYKSSCDKFSALLEAYWNGTDCLVDKRF